MNVGTIYTRLQIISMKDGHADEHAAFMDTEDGYKEAKAYAKHLAREYHKEMILQRKHHIQRAGEGNRLHVYRETLNYFPPK